MKLTLNWYLRDRGVLRSAMVVLNPALVIVLGGFDGCPCVREGERERVRSEEERESMKDSIREMGRESG